MSNVFDFFQVVYCINLDSRPDRWQEAMREFEALGIAGRVERVAAIVHANPREGCRLSHLECVRRATAAGAETALIFEDDVTFPAFSPAHLARSLDRLRAVPDWELFYLGGFVMSPPSERTEHLVRAHVAQMHGYAIHRRAFATIQSSGTPIDLWCAWHMKSYCAQPLLAWQRDGQSDIEGRWTSRARDARWAYAHVAAEPAAEAIVREFARRNLRLPLFRARVRHFVGRIVRVAARFGGHLVRRRNVDDLPTSATIPDPPPQAIKDPHHVGDPTRAPAPVDPPQVSVVVPHGGRERLPLLAATLASLRQSPAVGEIIVVELGAESVADDIAARWADRHLFVAHDGPFDRAKALNTGTAVAAHELVVWHDNDLLHEPDLLGRAAAELVARELDALVPYTAVHYLDLDDSAQARRGELAPEHAAVMNRRGDVMGGIGVVRRAFAQRHGGLIEGFCGWGGEDEAWAHKAAVCGRFDRTRRADQIVWHLHHALSGGVELGRAIAANPHFSANLERVAAVRAVGDAATLAQRFPPAPPALGTLRKGPAAASRADEGPPVWAYWEGSCPTWIRACRRTLLRHVPNLRLLTPETFEALRADDAEMRLDLSHLHVAHRADAIRAWLLARFGGLWIDADCLLMRPVHELPGWLAEHDFVGFRERSGLIGMAFMAARPGSRIAAAHWARVREIVARREPIGWTTIGSDQLTAIVAADRRGWHELPVERVQPVCWSRPQDFLAERASAAHDAQVDPDAIAYMMSNAELGKRFPQAGSDALLAPGTFFVHLLQRSLGSADPLPSLAREAGAADAVEIRRRHHLESVSGPGSSLGQTAGLRRRLPLLLEHLGVRRLLDAPCGDRNWMRTLRLPGIEVTGVDILAELVAAHRVAEPAANRRFVAADLLADPLPQADAVLCRDLLVHLPYAEIAEVLRRFAATGATWLITTHYTQPRPNRDIASGDWRPLHLEGAPFDLPPPEVVLVEGSTEHGSAHADKSLAVWRFDTVVRSAFVAGYAGRVTEARPAYTLSTVPRTSTLYGKAAPRHAAPRALDVVVARYQEELDWVLAFGDKAIIYNKGGEPLPHDTFPRQVTLPNIGRESHSYLYHLVHSYDDLADVTLFTQGVLEGHVSSGVTLAHMVDACRSLARKGPEEDQLATFLPPVTFDQWQGIAHAGKWLSEKQTGVMRAAQRTPGEFWSGMFQGQSPPGQIRCVWGAVFAVTRRAIQQRPKSFYMRLLELFEQINHVNPEEGHYMERFWLSIFGAGQPEGSPSRANASDQPLPILPPLSWQPAPPVVPGPMTMGDPVRSLWIGGPLSVVETLCIRSFQAHGHPFVLYTYRDINNLPDGVTVEDANTILPEADIFQAHGGSYAAFSDWFRWEVLARMGGWWVDTDVVCLAPFDFHDEVVLAWEIDTSMGTAALRFPADHACCRRMRERCVNVGRPRESFGWGEMAGPVALRQAAEAEGLLPAARPYFTFFPVNWQNAMSVFNGDLARPETDRLVSLSHALHLWNEMLRRNGVDKGSRFYHPESMFARLLRRYDLDA